MMIWLNGEWKAEGEAAVAANDGALLRGEGAFETMLALGGRVFEIERHWRRLELGCERFGLEICEVAEGREICEELLRRNELVDGGRRIRVRVTRTPDHLVFTASEGQGYPEKLVLVTSPFVRNEKSALAGIKAISYGENSLALAEGKKRGAHEVLFANTKGDWCEGAWSNVFAVEKGRVLTPPLASGCLAGVTREVVMELARETNLEVEEVAVPLARVGEMEEVFMTSSLLGVGAVTQFEGQEFTVGPVTQRLAKLLGEREKALG
ncbi:MAG: aminotransferase class IV [Roseibacillus sp.]